MRWDPFNRRRLRDLTVVHDENLQIIGRLLAEQRAAETERRWLTTQRDALLRAVRPAYREWLLRTNTYEGVSTTRQANLVSGHRVDLENALDHLRDLGLLDGVDPLGDERSY